MHLDLSDFFTTKAQASDFSARLATIGEATYQTSFNLEKALMDQFGVDKKDKLMAIIRENNISVGSAPQVKEFVAKLQEAIAQIPLLPLTIAFEPTGQILKNMSDWFFMNLKKQVLFDIKIDKNIIAGAAVTYNGKFLDFSVKA